MKPLEGYTVIDLTTFVAAPVCARLLGEFGARVIKIESPKGDGWRRTGAGFVPSRFNDVENPIFDIYNSGKDMISLNLKSEEGLNIMHQLLEKADIFITNNRPAALERLGLHYDQLKEKYPRLIYGIVTGYGEKGPDANKQAYDTTAFWSRSGFLRDTAVVGENEYYPVEAPSGVGDSYTGTNLAMQVLAAALQRHHTGKGQYISSSLYHIGAFAMGTMTIKTQRPFGTPMPSTRWGHRPVSGGFQCADGEWVYLASGVPTLDVIEAAGMEDVKNDPMWLPENAEATKKARYLAMKAAFLTKTREEWMEFLSAYDTPSVRLAKFADVSEDEQAWANNFVERVEYPTGNSNVIPTAPIKMSDLELRGTQITRRLGQDTEKVLSELGYTPEQIEKMAADGIVIK